MKRKFSTAWKTSKQPRKQRKYLANAPLHLRKKFVSVNLSKELRKKYKKRNIPAKKGDEVKIMRGKFKGKLGKITEVNLKLSKVIIEGIQAKKQDGSKVNIKLFPSNLQIRSLNLEDGKRIKGLEKQEERTESKKPVKKDKDKKGTEKLKETKEKLIQNKKNNTGEKIN